MPNLKLTDKHRDGLTLALQKDTRLLCLAGTTRSSKTIELIQMFFYAVQANEGARHLIACRDMQAIEENILISDGLGLTQLYPEHVKVTRGKLQHITLTIKKFNGTEATVTICSYSNKKQWTKILGGTFHVVLVDEVNVADEFFIDECFARQTSSDNPLTLWSLNGDNPEHFIYTKYINRCKPIWDCPREEAKYHTISNRMNGWYFTHWTMWDNPIMTDKKIKDASELYPVGSYYYTTKILGYRGVAEGAIFAQYLTDKHYMSKLLTYQNGASFNEDDYIKFCAGVDLGNNEVKKGTIVVISGITRGWQEVHPLLSLQCKSTETIALVNEITNFIDNFYNMLYNKSKMDSVRVDGYGAIQMIMETLKKTIRNKNINIGLALKFGDEHGRRARLQALLMLVQAERIKFNPLTKSVMENLKKLVYAEDGLPMDTNQECMDWYDALGYSITPFFMQLFKGGLKV